MSLLVPFCDTRTKLATVVIPRKCGEERHCKYDWQARSIKVVREAQERRNRAPFAKSEDLAMVH